MVTIRNKETGEIIGTISDEDFQFLQDELEEESSTDTDYYINKPTVDMLEQDDAPPSLIALLRKALGSRSDVEIEWSRS